MPMHESSCIEDPSFFRSLSLFLSVSVIVPWLFCLFRCTHTVWLKFESPFIPWSSSLFMRAVSVASDLFNFSIHFISLLIISLITFLFLLPDTCYFHDVVHKYPAYFRWCPWHPGRERAFHRLWAQRLPHLRDYWTIHPGILRRQQVLICAWSGAMTTPVFTQEREDASSRRQAYHSHDEG